MYTFKKYVEGIAIHYESGSSRLLTAAETKKVFKAIPDFKNPKLYAYYLDEIPESLNILYKENMLTNRR